MAPCSLDLYKNLCIVAGTETVVNTRRKLYIAMDYLSSLPFQVMITSGSKGEGLHFNDSDMDIMYICRSFEVCEETKDAKNIFHGKVIFNMDMEDTKPGFTKLYLHSFRPSYQIFLNSWCIGIGSKLYLSNVKFKSLFSSFNPGMCIVHGPCLSDRMEYFDLAYTLRCKKWVTPAQPWITRPRQMWPSPTLISTIIQDGVLFVPIGCKGSRYEEFEWRISFSLAEKRLIFSFNHTQLLCYTLLKFLLKDISKIGHMKELLCSYFMKTVMFWVSEEVRPSAWVPENIMTCFNSCLKRLVYCVQYLILQHYFIPEINFFENRFTEQQQKDLLTALSSTNFLKLVSERKNSHPTGLLSMSNDVWNVRQSYGFALRYLYESFRDRKKYQLISKFSKNRKKKGFLCMNSYYNLLLAQTFDVTQQRNNKERFIQYRQCLSCILQGLHHDVVSGWLMLASLFYKLGQYKRTLDILSYALSKLTQEKIDIWGDNYNATQDDLLSTLITSRPYSLIRLMSRVGVDRIWFLKNSTLVPHEVFSNTVYVPPAIFGYFLSFICHYHLGNFEKCLELLLRFESTIRERTFTLNKLDSATSFSCWGVALKMLQKHRKASVAFEAASYFRNDLAMGWRKQFMDKT